MLLVRTIQVGEMDNILKDLLYRCLQAMTDKRNQISDRDDVVCLQLLLYLKVKVSDLFGVQVADSIQDLLEELSGFLLAQRLLLCQKVKELTAGHPGRGEKEMEGEN